MAKLDLSDAYRHILVRRADWPLLGFTWPIFIQGELHTGYFMDMYLPFGARSSPALFLRFADALAFVMKDRGCDTVWHYLDDFFTCGPTSPNPRCAENLDVMLRTCTDLNFTVNPKKTTQPTTCLTLLGIELDSVQGLSRIDDERLREILDLVRQWATRSRCTKRQLQSLLGKLNFVCNVCRPGRTFLSRMIALLSKARHPRHHLRLTKAFKMDLKWWSTFLPEWNGKSFFLDQYWSNNTVLDLFTDASGQAFGACYQTAWLYDTFKTQGIPSRRSITFKELFAIIAALTAWGPKLTRKRIRFHCDNQAVVAILNKGSSKCPHVMTLARYAFYICARHSIEIAAVHIPGCSNNRADALSRLQIHRFKQLTPQATTLPTTTPLINLTPFQ